MGSEVMTKVTLEDGGIRSGNKKDPGKEGAVTLWAVIRVLVTQMGPPGRAVHSQFLPFSVLFQVKFSKLLKSRQNYSTSFKNRHLKRTTAILLN